MGQRCVRSAGAPSVPPHAVFTQVTSLCVQLRAVKRLDEPVRLHGQVVKGFGRGSKTLGIPTANLPQHALEQLPADFSTGIYFGWASVDGAGPFKMVTSVGWNPFFDNKTRTVEPHLLHEFPSDFYGAEIRLVITGYLRPEANFTSLESLIEEIHEDIRQSRACLEESYHRELSTHPHLRLRPWGGAGLHAKVGVLVCVGALAFLLAHKIRAPSLRALCPLL